MTDQNYYDAELKIAAWYTKSPPVLTGLIFNDHKKQRFRDGVFIRTSVIQSFSETKDGETIVQTLNTKYLITDDSEPDVVEEMKKLVTDET